MTRNTDWLDQEFQALADDEGGMAAPSSVKASVMNAWDARAARSGARRGRRRAVAWVTGACAAAAALMFVVMRPIADAPQGPAGFEVLHAREFVLVPDPLADQTPMQVMRVRMSRTALASLGVEVTDPGGGSLVEVELLVGDDGVARSIRRATFVNDTLEGGRTR